MHEANFYKPMLLFHIVVLISSLIFVAGMLINLKIILSGKKSNPGINLKSFVYSFFRDSLLQLPLLKLSAYRWFIHMLIFWGFIGLFIGTTRLFIYTDILSKDWVLFGQDLCCDIAGLMLFAGIIFAFLRRVISKGDSTLTEFEDTALLLFLLILDVSGFFVEAARIALTEGPHNEGAFFGMWLATFMNGISQGTATFIWTFHGLASALFIAYIPFSKLLHTFTAPAILSMNPEKYKGD